MENFQVKEKRKAAKCYLFITLWKFSLIDTCPMSL